MQQFRDVLLVYLDEGRFSDELRPVRLGNSRAFFLFTLVCEWLLLAAQNQQNADLVLFQQVIFFAFNEGKHQFIKKRPLVLK